MVVTASPPKKAIVCGLISSRLLSCRPSLYCCFVTTAMEKKVLEKIGTISDYTLAASAQVKVLPKKNPYVYFRLKDALMDRRPAKQGKSEWTGRHAWAWRKLYGRGFEIF